MPAKQHEILAIKSGVTGKVTKIFADLGDLFTNKRHHFTKEIVTFKPAAEGQPVVEEKNLELQTTVRKELAWGAKEFAKLLDVCHQINETNCRAKADVIIGGVARLKDVPVTGLLELEKFLLQTWKPLLEKIPTLDPVKGFSIDKATGEDVYKALPRITSRTAKEQYVMTLAPATDKHPAQAQLLSRDVVTGHKHELEWSGMLTPLQKSDLISRCEDFILAVKAAQSRGNNIEVVDSKIGEEVQKILLG